MELEKILLRHPNTRKTVYRFLLHDNAPYHRFQFRTIQTNVCRPSDFLRVISFRYGKCHQKGLRFAKRRGCWNWVFQKRDLQQTSQVITDRTESNVLRPDERVSNINKRIRLYSISVHRLFVRRTERAANETRPYSARPLANRVFLRAKRKRYLKRSATLTGCVNALRCALRS